MQAELTELEPIKEGKCGTPAPVRLASIGDEHPVRLRPPPTVSCAMLLPLKRWVEKALQPLAERHLSSRVTSIRVISSYACRTRYGRKGARMSEHAFANALDISGFELADGGKVSLLKHWGPTERDASAADPSTERVARLPTVEPRRGKSASDGRQRESRAGSDARPPLPVRKPLRGAATTGTASPRRSPPYRLGGPDPRIPANDPRALFLRESHTIACRLFTTTLGPEANEAHRNHFHLDMFPRRRRSYCE